MIKVIRVCGQRFWGGGIPLNSAPLPEHTFRHNPLACIVWGLLAQWRRRGWRLSSGTACILTLGSSQLVCVFGKPIRVNALLGLCRLTISNRLTGSVNPNDIDPY